MNSEDSDCYDEEFHDPDDIQEEINVLENEVNKSPSVIEITTEGISHSDINKISKSSSLVRCLYCGRYYKNTMIIYDQDGGEQCRHCFFWMNYDEKTRLEFDKACAKLELGIADYILECNEKHDVAKCLRSGVGCFLCDFKLKVPIVNILNSEMLGQTTQTQVIETESKLGVVGNEATNDTNDIYYFSGDACVTESTFKIPRKIII